MLFLHYKEIEKIVLSIMPKDCEVTKIEPEGLSTVIFIKNVKAFYSSERLIKDLATTLKKKVHIRSDSSVLMEIENTKQTILSLVPKEAEIKNIMFAPEFSEVHIEALKPGLVIGKGGSLLKEIMLRTGWAPVTIRAPTMPSSTLDGIRKGLIADSENRKKFLLNIGKKICQPMPNSDWVRLVSLGGFREVGRSCVLLQTQNSKVLLDCGINAATGDPAKAYPYLNMLGFNISELDAVVISHGHIDHMGFVPYLYAYGYEGPVYCTPPTRDIMVLLQQDYINLSKRTFGIDPPYTKKDIQKELRNVIPVDYQEVVDITSEIKMTFYNAGHILGSASVHLHVGEGLHNVVYSGDIKYGFTRLFEPANTMFPRVETLLIESTYGGKNDISLNRVEADNRLFNTIKQAIDKRGKVLLPVFAVGRAQELLLVLEDFYRRNPDFNVPVYIDGMVLEASAIHTAYPEYLREQLQRRILSNQSPFESPMIKVAKGTDKETIVNGEPAIILAPSGMLNGGPSYEYFNLMAEEEKNTLLFVGYQSALSLGNKLQRGLKEVPMMGDDGRTKILNIKMNIATADGYSVPYDTDVMIKRNDVYEIVKIGKIADEHIDSNVAGNAALKHIQVPAFDDQGKIKWHKASQVIKHKSRNKHLKIRTKAGMQVQISKGHSLFRLKNTKITSQRGEDLQVGDYIIIPKKLPESHTLTSLDFANFIDPMENGYTLDRNINAYIPQTNAWRNSFLNATCNDITSLAKFLGYYMAEGHYDEGDHHSRAVLSFGTHEKELIEDATLMIKNAFGLPITIHKPHPTAVQLKINNKLLVDFLQNIGVGKGAKNKRIPNIVFNFSKENQKEFLKAYFKGDGYIYKTTRKKYLAAKSASIGMLSDIAYILHQHGIIARIKGPFKEPPRMLNGHLIKETTAYKLYISELNLEPFVQSAGHLPFALPINEIALNKITSLITDKDLRKLATDYIYNARTKGRKYIGLGVIKKFLANASTKNAKKDQKEILDLLNKFVFGDIAVDIIEKIEEVESGEFEFDFSVPGVENFVGGLGGIMLHNSGHADRAQLMAYLRNMRPTPDCILAMHGDWGKTDEFAKSAAMMLRKEGRALQNLEARRLR